MFENIIIIITIIIITIIIFTIIIIIIIIWRTNTIQPQWRRVVNILIHKKDNTDDPSNFRPTALQLINWNFLHWLWETNLFSFWWKTVYSERFYARNVRDVWNKAHFTHLTRSAKWNQISLVVKLLDLRHAFGELHYNLMLVVLAQHHIPDNIIKAIMPIFEDFVATIATVSFTTLFYHIKKCVLKVDCLSSLTSNWIINTSIQFISLSHKNSSTNSTIRWQI